MIIILPKSDRIEFKTIAGKVFVLPFKAIWYLLQVLLALGVVIIWTEFIYGLSPIILCVLGYFIYHIIANCISEKCLPTIDDIKMVFLPFLIVVVFLAAGYFFIYKVSPFDVLLGVITQASMDPY